ncbi:tRNA glutamyl-Q(34) synthetase GluQRS [Pseudooceanicola nitratireducens]|uniref:tRNA glutamyl-Q(34) synthetase GluQRS n=1 Tax=Pseudooceanicola nitratireducens TaxID=517719 RepID=UPI001C977A64|nr:tRNA glutamyl-Q(34) synthetase GluQRS [Pseudooceanicola nitratireducens]MBY6157029.1 tRNA glutamyl-Q(34) synthetase GluQRS [Pseudooceanicola nitratireducens]
MVFTTRFAPSPTGPLHLGHAYSAILAHDLAQQAGGRFLLRIEDIDQSRARPEWEAQIYDDLAWLGLTWEDPVLRQSNHLPRYRAALAKLWDDGLLYPCTCRRKDIENALSAPQEGAPTHGPDGLIYPGTCRETGTSGLGEQMPENAVLRLNMEKALARTRALYFTEEGTGPNGETGQIPLPADQILAATGDIIVARKDMGTSYHLSVVVDDAVQGITHVTRGQDLFEATQIHCVLQDLLGLPRPIYHHHRLIRDDQGKRLAKRDDARAIATYRDEGLSPADLRRMIGL